MRSPDICGLFTPIKSIRRKIADAVVLMIEQFEKVVGFVISLQGHNIPFASAFVQSAMLKFLVSR
jgi:hypothetical protein